MGMEYQSTGGMMSTKNKASEARLESARRYKREHRAELAAKRREYMKTVSPDVLKRMQESTRRSQKKWVAAHPDYEKNRDSQKVAARQAIRNRVFNGTLERGMCSVCNDANAHAHHEDYAKPLEIVWLCTKHHAAVHSGKLPVKKEWIFHV